MISEVYHIIEGTATLDHVNVRFGAGTANAIWNATGGALNYHAASVSPDWADTMDKTTQIGNHVFYKNASHSRTM